MSRVVSNGAPLQKVTASVLLDLAEQNLLMHRDSASTLLQETWISSACATCALSQSLAHMQHSSCTCSVIRVFHAGQVFLCYSCLMKNSVGIVSPLMTDKLFNFTIAPIFIMYTVNHTQTNVVVHNSCWQICYLV